MKALGLFVLLVSFISCDYFSENRDKEIVVEYKGLKLYKDDLNKILPQTYTKEESINIVVPYIQNWLQKKVTVNSAIQKIAKEEINELDQQIIDYRDDLILNKFYNKQLEKLNETAIPETEIVNYYHDNERSFTLNEDLAKAQYIIAPLRFKKVIIENLQSSDTLKTICAKYEEMECYSSDEWVNFQQLLGLFNLKESENSIPKLKNNPLQQIERDQKFYLIKWTDFRQKGETGPYEFYKKTIKSILINKRKLNLQKHIEDSLYNDAIQNNKIKFYE